MVNLGFNLSLVLKNDEVELNLMSLQRIFESARKLGLPVIVTDPAGREPMVVLPLEQFEAMAGAGEVREIPVEPVVTSQKTSIVEELATFDPVSPTVETEAFSSVLDTVHSPEISLEEGFYLERADDQGMI